MLAIVTCLRSRAVSDNWELHVWLLQRTLDSILAQTRQDFRVIVVCHETPDIAQFCDPKIEAVTVSFPPPQRNNDEMCADKVLKLTAGAERALQHGCDYVMFADGDDLVSNRLCQFVSISKGACGWYNATEYYHRYGGRWLWRRSIPAPGSSPTVIVRSDLLRFSDSGGCRGQWLEMVSAGGRNQRYLASLSTRGRRVNTLAAVGHNLYPALMADKGLTLQRLPFPGSVVILHPDSTSSVPGGEGSAVDITECKTPPWRQRLSRVRRLIPQLVNLRPITKELCHEFTIPARASVPDGYQDLDLPIPS